MEDKFRGFRIASARLPGYDYSLPGYYFITICTQNRMNFFGNVVGGEMELSVVGKMVAEEWKKTERIRSDVKIDEWVVMPNYLHGIVFIKKDNLVVDGDGRVETHYNASLRANANVFGPQSNNLAAIIRGFKGAVTKNVHVNGFLEFAWQSRFYDHIIRDDRSLNRIREYIRNNPFNWERDRNNI